MEMEMIQPTIVKEIPSDTKTIAKFVQFGKNDCYFLAVSDHGRYGKHTCAYYATKRGKPNLKRQVFSFRGNDIEKGLEHLINVKNNLEEPRNEKVYG